MKGTVAPSSNSEITATTLFSGMFSCCERCNRTAVGSALSCSIGSTLPMIGVDAALGECRYPHQVSPGTRWAFTTSGFNSMPSPGLSWIVRLPFSWTTMTDDHALHIRDPDFVAHSRRETSALLGDAAVHHANTDITGISRTGPRC